MICGLVKKSETSPPLLMGKNLEIFTNIKIVVCALSPPRLPTGLPRWGFLYDFFATLPIVAKKCCKDFENMENVAKSML